MKKNKTIIVRQAREHNLKGIDVDIPHHCMTVVTGVSGSGKSSLVFDTIYREGRRRYLESFSAYARRFLGKWGRPAVGHISGLSPTIAVDQKTVVRSPRSTVGTMSELYDHLRLLFARLGRTPEGEGETMPRLERSMFSFNSPKGACPDCGGLGVQDRIDVDLLISDPAKTLREGALVITTPSGYIIYSQVTMEVLNRVCNAHGFDVDIPWKDMTTEQKDIVLNGSDKIKIPYGKHPLESRLKWSGITAKPREESHYKGILPVMENILRVSRNDNILRFARTVPCSSCGGARLNPAALGVLFHDKNIHQYAAMTIDEVVTFFHGLHLSPAEAPIAGPLLQAFLERAELLQQLGLGYLTLHRQSTTLSGGEAQRIRLATQVGTKLRGILYILDEPSIGLHHRDTQRLLNILHQLRENGNTLLVVEHDEDTIRAADHLIDIGPGAGVHGGQILASGGQRGSFEKPPLWKPHKTFDCTAQRHAGAPDCTARASEYVENNGSVLERGWKSRTLAFLTGEEFIPIPEQRRPGNGKSITIFGARHNNLQNLDVSFPLGTHTVVTGVSGAGKSSLVHDILANTLRRELQKANTQPGAHDRIEGIEHIDKIIEIDQTPIGRTPRSNPATYTKLFDHIRDLFAALPESKKRKWPKGRFSFNVKGGRCETCEGAGVQTMGMHFMGSVETTCDQCGGKRFNDETLEVLYREKSINDILEMSIETARQFFNKDEHPKLMRYLDALSSLGLDYITLGQPSTTLSGGEAQRIKLATELSKPSTGKTLYIFDEPTTGLHAADIQILLHSLHQLLEKGNTVITVEHHPDIIKTADHLIDLGPESSTNGGQIIATGTPEAVASVKNSHTGNFLRDILPPAALRGPLRGERQGEAPPGPPTGVDFGRHLKMDAASGTYSRFEEEPILLKGVRTHNLKNIDVTIPVNTLTVITGVSGSGKSSLAFDTLFAEGQQRFLSSLSTYARRLLGNISSADMESASGLMPTIAVSQKTAAHNPRSTVGTMTEIYDYYRLLFSRLGTPYCPQCENKEPLTNGSCPGCGFKGRSPLWSNMFSFNHHAGACEHCKGLGTVTTADPEKLVTHPGESLLSGALDGSKTGKFYGDPYGQHTAILRTVGEEMGLDFTLPWEELSEEQRRVAMYGTGERQYDVTWKYKRKNRTGEHRFETRWEGFVNYVNEEYERKHADRRGDAMLPLMKDEPCPSCGGLRLKKEFLMVHFHGLSIAELSHKTVEESIVFFQEMVPTYGNGTEVSNGLDSPGRAIGPPRRGVSEVLRRLSFLRDVGLGYLTMDRGSTTLSGGEAQRIRLVGQLGSGLTGVTYVLDEPTIGLHSRDTRRLLGVLEELRDLGNTVVVVEHDAEVISAADHIIDLGPGSGVGGGEIVAQGSLEDIKEVEGSLTAAYLNNPGTIPVPDKRHAASEHIEIVGAAANNLADISLTVPLEGMVVLTGVSGSGKSTLLFDVMAASLEAGRAVGCREFRVPGSFSESKRRVVRVGQGGMGVSPASTPATYTGVFDVIRGLFAKTPPAVERGYKKGRFSFNSKGGRCEVCQGMGRIKTSMDFLADVWTECEECRGKRYNEETLECLYEGKSIADVLEMAIDEAGEFFVDKESIRVVFEQLSRVGLGYVCLGQGVNTLSGGELQRLRFAAEVIKAKGEGNIYLLDEPTTGLHFSDVGYLLECFRGMVGEGHVLYVIEHHPDVIKSADYVVDLGPEGGDGGGRVVVAGVPEEVAVHGDSHTAGVLQPFFQ